MLKPIPVHICKTNKYTDVVKYWIISKHTEKLG